MLELNQYITEEVEMTLAIIFGALLIYVVKKLIFD